MAKLTTDQKIEELIKEAFGQTIESDNEHEIEKTTPKVQKPSHLRLVKSSSKRKSK